MLPRFLALLKHRVLGVASITFCGLLIFSSFLTASRPGSALPIPKGAVYAIPAFTRKYAMPCSSCHEAWPKLSPSGQAFKDNG
jgi:hypothetical protein